MTDKKYTNEEIVKALEDYIKENEFEYFHSNIMNEYPLIKKSLDIINRQKAEIEKLRAKVETRTQEKLALGRIYTQKLKTVKYETYYEAYKEFAERIRECCDLNNDLSTDAWLSVTADIDSVLKEMVGEEND